MTKPFLTSVTNRIDAKGRVSVPAHFRAILTADGARDFACFESFQGRYLEGYTKDGMDAFAAKIETLQKYSATRDAFEYAVLGSVHELSFDSEGRVVLPQALMAYAELSEAATFVGLGDHFEIWKPESFAAKIAEMRRLAAERRHLLDADGEAIAKGEGA